MTKRVRWECPNGCAGVLGSSRPRTDDVVRYCLICSAATGCLVKRSAPALERRRAARKALKARKRAQSAERTRERANIYYIVGGTDLREVLRAAWKLPTVQERIYRMGSFVPLAEPSLTVRRVQTIRRRLGQAECEAHRITVYIAGTRDYYKPETFGDLVETILHEVVHIALGERPGAIHDHVFKAMLVSVRQEYIEACKVGSVPMQAYLDNLRAAPSCDQPFRDQDEDCEHCDGTGHQDGCESRERAFEVSAKARKRE